MVENSTDKKKKNHVQYICFTNLWSLYSTVCEKKGNNLTVHEMD